MSEIIKVGMADLKTCLPPNGITTLGLGSCVGIALRDKNNKVGGLAHIMLPDSTVIANQTNVAKFADTGIVELLKQMEKLGAVKRNIVAKIAGGATMFAMSSRTNLNVGERSSASIARRLQDPLSELVKIDPKAIGVGQYQHDMNQKRLSEALNDA